MAKSPRNSQKNHRLLTNYSVNLRSFHFDIIFSLIFHVILLHLPLFAPVLLVFFSWQSAFDCLCVGLSLPTIQDWQFRFPWSLRGWRPQVQQIQLLLCLVPQTFRGSHATGECQCHATSQRQIFHAEDYSPTPMMARSLLYKLCQHKVSQELNPSVWLQRPFVASEKFVVAQMTAIAESTESTEICCLWSQKRHTFFLLSNDECFTQLSLVCECFSLPKLFFFWSTDCLTALSLWFSPMSCGILKWSGQWGPGVSVNEKLFKEAPRPSIWVIGYLGHLGPPFFQALKALLESNHPSHPAVALFVLWSVILAAPGSHDQAWLDAHLQSDERVSREQRLGWGLRILRGPDHHWTSTRNITETYRDHPSRRVQCTSLRMHGNNIQGVVAFPIPEVNGNTETDIGRANMR